MNKISISCLVNCPIPQIATDYAPRSFLYVNSIQKIYVCDETADR